MKPRPPHLQRHTTRHGKHAWYVRVAGKLIRIRGEYGSQGFNDDYLAAINPYKPGGAPRTGKDTLAWLVDRYKDSPAWARLSEATQSQRANIYKRVCMANGDVPYTAITKQHVQTGVNTRSATPFGANDFLKAMRGLFGWAKKADFIDVDPTEGVTGFPHKTEGFHTWTEEEIARFEAYWAVGTKEYLAFAILLYTGLRRGDASRLGRQHIRNGVITFRTAKTGQQIIIPLLPQLAQIMTSTKTGDLALIATAAGHPMTKESFGNWFHDACKAAGVPGAAHGLRKAGATRAANNGATEAELNAIFGWHGSKMSSLYTKTADRARLARNAMEKLKK